jgi:hypothetical protein
MSRYKINYKVVQKELNVDQSIIKNLCQTLSYSGKVQTLNFIRQSVIANGERLIKQIYSEEYLNNLDDDKQKYIIYLGGQEFTKGYYAEKNRKIKSMKKKLK